MKTSKNGIDFIKKEEGCILEPYRCSANKLTIGYGHVILKGEDYLNGVITEKIAQEVLEEDLEKFETNLNQHNLKLNQNQFDALVSFMFNVGITAFNKSTLLRVLKKDVDNLQDIQYQLNRWNKVKREINKILTKRRVREFELYSKQLKSNSMSFLSKIANFAPKIAKVVANPVGAGIELLLETLGVDSKEEAEEKISKSSMVEIEQLENNFAQQLELKKIDLEERKLENQEYNISVEDTQDARKKFCENTFVVRGIMGLIYLAFICIVALTIVAYVIPAKGDANIIHTVIMLLVSNVITNSLQWFVGKIKQTNK